MMRLMLSLLVGALVNVASPTLTCSLFLPVVGTGYAAGCVVQEPVVVIVPGE